MQEKAGSNPVAVLQKLRLCSVESVQQVFETKEASKRLVEKSSTKNVNDVEQTALLSGL